MKLRYALYIVLLFALVPARSSAQYLSRLYDGDSTSDWGTNVFIQSDGNHFIIAEGLKSKWQQFVKRIDTAGNELVNKKLTTSPVYHYTSGRNGAVKQLPDGGFILPFSVRRIGMNGSLNDFIGLARLNSAGDTLWTRYYTDTFLHKELVADCAVMPDGGFVLVGSRQHHVTQTTYAIILKTDSLGNLEWRNHKIQVYEFFTADYASNGQIVVGGGTHVLVNLPTDFYYRSAPWFLTYDLAGNLLHDTLFSGQTYAGGGSIMKDKNGGYFHYGVLDTVVNGSVSDYRSLPDYIANLDDNFGISWIKVFRHPQGHPYIWNVKQLKDGSYLLVGNVSAQVGWLSKLDRNGFTVWSSYYFVDSTWAKGAYLTDAIEGADGRIVATGSTRADKSPNWKGSDVWLLVVDKDGCIIPGCNPLSVKQEQVYEPKSIALYPNPVKEDFTLRAAEAGTFTIVNMQGLRLCSYPVLKGTNALKMPPTAAPGLYIGTFVSGKDNSSQVIRFAF